MHISRVMVDTITGRLWEALKRRRDEEKLKRLTINQKQYGNPRGRIRYQDETSPTETPPLPLHSFSQSLKH